MKKIVIKENGKVYDFSNYSCSPDGVVTNINTGKTRKPQLDKDGYHYLTLHREGKKKFFRVHRVVAHLYCENEDPEVNTVVHHKDNDKDNNHYTNLMWTTISFNTKEGYRTGEAYTKGENHSQARLTNEDVIEICEHIKEGKLIYQEIADLYGVKYSSIAMIASRKNWTHITKNIDF